ncbi:type II toxin-antitoxin system RelE/ParE family toxin [candidate division WOR-3 bacterium]|nr:type II toxin-antitoxin system RelE/ParE family toxin [candidate division WOR-3 bacterium]
MKDSEYRILYKSGVEKDIKQIEIRERKRIIQKIEAVLSQNPYKGKQLKGEYKGFWRIRVGDHRVVYRIIQKDVVIVAVGHRKEIYKRK